MINQLLNSVFEKNAYKFLKLLTDKFKREGLKKALNNFDRSGTFSKR